MTEPDEHGRVDPPLAGDEFATLLGFLDYQRATLAWKCRGLDGPALATRIAASSMSLGGILKHMGLVEDVWFTRRLRNRDWPAPWEGIDWTTDPDWEWRTAADDPPERLFALWQDAVERSRASTAETLARGGLDQLAERTFPDGTAPSLRWILCHMIEEYARHNGHADLMREAIDGETGE
jgi:uncharacterized damage-inducible protein DinB